MKKIYKIGVWLGTLSIVASFLFPSIPFGNKSYEIVGFLIYILGCIAVLILGKILKNDKDFFISTVFIIIVEFFAVAVIEFKHTDCEIIPLGCLLPFLLALIGIFKSVKYKGKYKMLYSYIINTIGIMLSVVSFLLGLTNL